MVLYRNHLKSAGGEPRNYGSTLEDKAPKPHQNGRADHPASSESDQTPSREHTASNGDALSGRKSTSSNRRHHRVRRSKKEKRAPQKHQKKTRIVSAYDVTLLVRSRNPIADAHDPSLHSDDLPDHHVPSFVSVASKAFQRQGHSGSYISRQRAKLTAKRDKEATKSTSSLPPAYWRSGGSKRFAQPAAAQKEFTKSSLPLLSFQNPWDSFQPPTLANVWQGLKWGLPEGYEEGGAGKYRGEGRHASRTAQHDAALESELGKGWTNVDVQTPNWGWTESERQTWLEGPNVERENEEDRQKPVEERAPGPTYGRRKEWQDPRAEEPGNFARVAWLGHATTLLQLPPLADPMTMDTNDPVEEEPGKTQGGVKDKPLDAQVAQQLVSQVSDVPPQQVGGDEEDVPVTPSRKKIVIKDNAPQARKKGQGEAKDGLPTTQDSTLDAIPDESDSDSDSDSGDGDGDGEDQHGDEDGAAPSAAAAEPATPRSMVIDNTRDRSINIIFDPIFSKRCSPSQTVGPVRFTEPPCQVEDLPPIDVILLSHDHYDHSDVESLKKILDRRGQAVHVFAGLGNKDWIVSACGFKRSQVSELDWWDEAILTASGSPVRPGDEARAALRIICTPAQHGSGRVPGGKDSTLWCSWMIETITPARAAAAASEPPQDQDRWRAFYAGDTGLRRHGEKFTNRKSPVCPAFEEAARRYGTPHLFLLPISIGSSLSYLRSKDPFPRRYSPFPRVSESLTSCIHMDTEDAVTMMELMTGYAPRDRKDAGVKEGGEETQRGETAAPASSTAAPPIVPTSLAVHFGTFVRNKEQTKSDVRNLQGACKRHGIQFQRTHEGRYAGEHSGTGAKGRFLVAHQGETVWVRM